MRLALSFLLLAPLIAGPRVVTERETGQADGERSSRPNLVVILADDLGYGDLGCYGSEIETPNLDALAARGLRFRTLYTAAKCKTSRVSLLSGLYCHQAGGYGFENGVTLAEVARSAGYFTAMTGKWHLDGEPTDFGFDRYWGHLSGYSDYFASNEYYRLNGEPWSTPPPGESRRFYTTRAVTDFALGFLDEALAEERPFFLYLAYNAPHYPLQAPKSEVRDQNGRYDGGWDEVRARRHARQVELGLVPKTWQLPPRPAEVPAWETMTAEEREWEADRMEVYAAMVHLLDHNVGRLVGGLREREVLDDTLILFCSDNGASPFERTEYPRQRPWVTGSFWSYDVGWAQVCNVPFRLFKQNQHEGGIASPLIAHWPAGLGTRPGAITPDVAHLVDFLPTLIELSGAELPVRPERLGQRELQDPVGRSLLPTLRGEERPPREDLYFHYKSNRALRQGDWKLVSAKLGRWELYDLASDGTEMFDLAPRQAERVEAMADEWMRLAREVDLLADPVPVSDELRIPVFRGEGAEADEEAD